MNHPARLKNLAHQLEAKDLDGLLIVHLPNIRYLCGFTGSSGILAFFRGEWSFFTDGRYIEQAKSQVKGAALQISSLPPLAHFAEWAGQKMKRHRSTSRLGIEAEHTTLAMQTRIHSELKRTVAKSRYRIAETAALVEQFRIRKDPQEISTIRKAVALASSIFPEVVSAIDSRITENDLAAELEHLARRGGAEKMSFETIVAAGLHSAMPHARPGRDKLRRGFVVLDYGVILGGYCSDMTRTVCVGRADKTAREIYSAVLEAQLAGIEAVGPGVEAQAVDSAARKVLSKHKLEKYFPHSLGHGVGLEIHEAPRLAKGQTQKLEAGMVVTIEPGVYIPGRGGVRIEDMVLVTRTGREVLTPTPKELVIR